MATMVLTLLLGVSPTGGTSTPVGVVELRNYLINDGDTDAFIDYFERRFIDSQQAEGIQVLGQFRMVGDPNRFVWIRGFANMSARREALSAFYSGPVWEEYGPRANEMMLAWNNVHLLSPIGDTPTGIEVPRPAASEHDRRDGGVVVVDFLYPATGSGRALAERFERDVRPEMIRRNIHVIALLSAEMTENDFPRLPVIQDERVLVVLSSYADEDALRRARDGLFHTWTDVRTETMVLRPTARSPIRHQAPLVPRKRRR